MTLPSIAVSMPSLNWGSYIGAAISSVLDQKYPHAQLAVMDGGSTDGALGVIHKHAPRLHYWRSHKDEGWVSAIVEGFKHTSAEIMCVMGSDDMHLPWTLQTVGQIFRDCPEVQWLTTEVLMVIDAFNIPEMCWCINGFSQGGWHRKENLIHEDSKPGASFIEAEATFWRRSLWDKAGGGYDMRFPNAYDYELWDRFMDLAPLYSVNIPLACFRRHSLDQISGGRRHIYVEQCKAILNRHKPKEWSETRHYVRRRPDDGTFYTRTWAPGVQSLVA